LNSVELFELHLAVLQSCDCIEPKENSWCLIMLHVILWWFWASGGA